MKLNLESFDLPETWACALMYGDESGMDDAESAALDAFITANTCEGRSFACVDVADTDAGDFRRWHDASPFWPLACNVATFTFDMGKI